MWKQLCLSYLNEGNSSIFYWFLFIHLFLYAQKMHAFLLFFVSVLLHKKSSKKCFDLNFNDESSGMENMKTWPEQLASMTSQQLIIIIINISNRRHLYKRNGCDANAIHHHRDKQTRARAHRVCCFCKQMMHILLCPHTSHTDSECCLTLSLCAHTQWTTKWTE